MKKKNVGRVCSELTMPAMTNKGKSITGKVFDFKSHEGERVRVHIGEDDKFTIETRVRQNLLICELDVPQKIFLQVDSGEVDEFGKPMLVSKEKDLDITKVTLKEYVTDDAEIIEI